MATVELRGIGKTYDGGRRGAVRAVEGVDLAIRHGEFVVLVGPSGCGKSTLLRMIAGLEPITDGTLSIDGRVVNDVPPKDRDIAFVFQNYALYPHLSVRRNLAFGLERRARTGLLAALLSGEARARRRRERESIEARVAKAAETLGLATILERMPRELSGGQRQRVAVGRAIVRDPKVFLFDEPLSNLDARLRIEMRGELRRLHRALGATMVYVTHDQEEAMSLGDRLVVMRDGRVQQIGPPGEVYAKPANRFVAGFVGTPPMNLIEGRLHRLADGAQRFACAGIALDLPPGKAADATPGPVIGGIRPDRIAVAAAAARMPWRGDARVERAEAFGDRTELHLRVGSESRVDALLARVDGSIVVAEGDAITIGIDPADLHLFAADDASLRIG